MQPDLKLRADVAVEVMGYVKLVEWEGTRFYRMGKKVPIEKSPPYELSLDACREVLAEIERRGLRGQFIWKLIEWLPPNGIDERTVSDGWAFVNATPKMICRSALMAVREAKET